MPSVVISHTFHTLFLQVTFARPFLWPPSYPPWSFHSADDWRCWFSWLRSGAESPSPEPVQWCTPQTHGTHYSSIADQEGLFAAARESAMAGQHVRRTRMCPQTYHGFYPAHLFLLHHHLEHAQMAHWPQFPSFLTLCCTIKYIYKFELTMHQNSNKYIHCTFTNLNIS